MDSQCLTCPQLLSEDALREILKNRWIEQPNFELMSKIKLLEIFTRVALPLSQRIYNEERPLGRKLQSLRSSRNIAIANYDENTNFSGKTQLSDSKSSDNSINGGHNDRLKPPVDDTKILQKRIRLSSTDRSEVHVDNSNDMKRKCQTSSQSDSNKRQKITWP
ncbi:hypothetical protein PV327_002238 [Microctonus hyperodae]|uniref:Uncharacterized protein n=1 Tax=Microctonus hyperodae TaxID=165561 RepID=A0AA39FF79_MICHY|nr:hypothetical protein PV327_002238 [Microctonus hyperodae]